MKQKLQVDLKAFLYSHTLSLSGWVHDSVHILYIYVAILLYGDHNSATCDFRDFPSSNFPTHLTGSFLEINIGYSLFQEHISFLQVSAWLTSSLFSNVVFSIRPTFSHFLWKVQPTTSPLLTPVQAL